MRDECVPFTLAPGFWDIRMPDEGGNLIIFRDTPWRVRKAAGVKKPTYGLGKGMQTLDCVHFSK